ncbi:hypothetical protein K438DRAFT_1977723 [Mycena galopus ATCC 62051]|nr:hypothetical protein K438DRAFT_1977723 [Mycena galopus ATCC 62051]
MGAQEWTTAAQRDYLTNMLPLFLVALAKPGNKAQQRFWATLNEGWFDLFPEPAPPNASTEDVAAALEQRKDRLKTWMRYRKSTRGMAATARARKKTDAPFKAFQKKKKGTRPYRAVEVYQKIHGPKVRQEALRRGYGLLTDEAEVERLAAGPALVLSAEETKEAELREELESMNRALENRRERMRIQRAAATALLDAETEAVKQEVMEQMAVLNAARKKDGGAELEDAQSPEQYQHAIDQLVEVATGVLQIIEQATGWKPTLLCGGPMPSRGGAISAKVICLGTTPLGTDFQAFHPNFDEAVKLPFVQFLKRAFPHEIRDARVIEAIPGTLEGLLRIDVQDSEDEEAASASASASVKPAKRIRKKPVKKSAATVPTLDIAVSTAEAPTTTLIPTAAASASASEPATPPSEDLPGLPGFDLAIAAINSDSYGLLPADAWSGDEHGSAYQLGGSSAFSPSGLRLREEMFSFGDDPRSDDATELLPPPSSLDPFPVPVFIFDNNSGNDRPAPRAIHRGASFISDRDIGDSFGREPSVATAPRRLTLPPAGVGLYSPPPPAPPRLSWTPSCFPTPSGLFDAFRGGRPTAASSSTINSLGSGAINGVAPVTVTSSVSASSANAPSSAHSLEASPPSQKIAAPATLALFRSVVTNVSSTPAPSVGPGYFKSRPMAHPPKAPRKPRAGGAPAAAAPALQSENEEQAGSAPPKRKPGRSRKTADAPPPPPPGAAAATSTSTSTTPALTGAVADAESARIRREAAQLRSTTTEMLTRSKAMDAEKEKAEAGKRRLAELRRNPTGGADLVVVTRSKSKSQKDLDGSSLVRPVRKSRGEMTGSSLAKAVDPNVVQKAQDADLLARLQGKRKAQEPPRGPKAPR